MDKNSRFLPLAVSCLVILATAGKGVSGQPAFNDSTPADQTGTQDSASNANYDGVIPEDSDAAWQDSFDDADPAMTSPLAEGAEEEAGLGVSDSGPDTTGVHGMSADTPTEDSPTEGFPTGDIVGGDSFVDGIPPEETPTDEVSAGNETAADDVDAAAPLDDEATTYEDMFNVSAGEDDGVIEGSFDDVANATTNATAGDTDTTGFVDDESENEEWGPTALDQDEEGEEWDLPMSDNDTTTLVTSPDDVRDTGFADNVTASEEAADFGNVTLSDSESVSPTSDDYSNDTVSDLEDTGPIWDDYVNETVSDSESAASPISDDYDNITASDSESASPISDDNDNVTASDSESAASPISDDYDDDYYDDYDPYLFGKVGEDSNMSTVNDTDDDVTSSVTTDESDDASSGNETVPDDQTFSNDTAADADKAPNDTPPDDVTYTNDTATDDSSTPSDASTDVIPTDDTKPQAPEKADFVVFDSNGKPCLLASLNITLRFKYHVQESLVRETYDTVSKNTQDGSSYQGSCEQSVSRLSITWNNDTFTLNLTFTMQDQDPDEIDMDVLPPGANFSGPSWTLQELSLSYDTANEQAFPGAYNPGVERVSAQRLHLFKTPVGMSYVCRTPELVSVDIKDVKLTFNSVHFMPFDVQSQNFSDETVECSGDIAALPEAEDSYTVPLVVAAILASIVIIILVVYATVRCVAKRLRQADYKQMQ